MKDKEPMTAPTTLTLGKWIKVELANTSFTREVLFNPANIENIIRFEHHVTPTPDTKVEVNYISGRSVEYRGSEAEQVWEALKDFA